MEVISIVIFFMIGFFIWYCCGGSSSKSASYSSPSSSENKLYPDLSKMKSNSMFSMFGGSNYSSFVDRFTSLEDVTTAVRKAGLESCGLIFGTDFTSSNMYQGTKTFGGKSLHSIDPREPNPYQRVGKAHRLKTNKSPANQCDANSQMLVRSIDYTASNAYQGQRTFGGQSLHSIGKMFLNPYQQ
ncbi:copine family protein 1-like, partial [Saccostrea cucullata]|uniref:copine family protein 1-like n=1 Tax=Saccostrea cuccullata TaxID=36930 RepID=UPI002ED58AA1